MLKIIEGSGTGEKMLKPKLVKNEQGQICMQVSLWQYECTLPIPEHVANAGEERLQEFFKAVVPEITKNLQKMASKDRRKSRRRTLK